MPWLGVTTNVTTLGGGGVSGTTGKSYWFRPDASAASTFHETRPPSGLEGVDNRVSSYNYANRHYGVGGWADNMLWDEHFRFMRQGIPAWTGKPTIAVGAAGGRTGSNVGYVTFYDEKTGERSPLSIGSAAVSTTNQKLNWSGLPTVEPEADFRATGTTTVSASTTVTGTGTKFTSEFQIGDKIAVSSAPTTFAVVLTIASDTSMTVSVALGAGTSQTITGRHRHRCSHIELWVAMDGATPRLAIRRQLGASTATEGIATLSLGEAFPTTFERMPRGTISAMYHDRQVVADYTDTIYLSGLFFPERYEGLNFKTRNGDIVVAMAESHDSLLCFTSTSCYELRGYTAADMTFKRLENGNGAINHWSVALIKGDLWIAHELGMTLYNGGFHPLMMDRQAEWSREYENYRSGYERGFSVYDPTTKTFRYYAFASHDDLQAGRLANPTSQTIQTVAWVAKVDHAVPEISGTFAAPEWMLWAYGRKITSAAPLAVPGSKRADLYFGSADGFIRNETPAEDDDDGDLFGKRLLIVPRHEFFGDPGGDIEEGKEFVRLWSYVESESVGWELYAFGGDEQAGVRAKIPNNSTVWWKEDVPASSRSDIIGGIQYDYAPKTVHPHYPERVSGRGLTLAWGVTNPIGFKWRGYGGYYKPGPATRGPVNSFPAS